jgi:hypothetical protein
LILVSGYAFSDTVEAARPQGEIKLMEPAAPAWGDTVRVVTETNYPYKALVIDCYSPTDPSFSHDEEIGWWTWYGDSDADGIVEWSSQVALDFGAAPTAAECVFTLWGVKRSGSYTVLDQLAFSLSG